MDFTVWTYSFFGRWKYANNSLSALFRHALWIEYDAVLAHETHRNSHPCPSSTLVGIPLCPYEFSGALAGNPCPRLATAASLRLGCAALQID
jgi:hypothetical protein